MKNKLALMLSIGLASTAWAQTNLPSEFPNDATLVKGADMAAQLAGKVFSVQTATQGVWRLQFSGNGYMYVDTEGGYQDLGAWRIEGDRWCAKLRKTGDACSELRAIGDTYYYKRTSNGEVVSMKVR